MLAVIGQLLSIAVAVALSTVPMAVTLTILLSPTASRSALAFLIGWVVGMFVVAGVFAFALNALPPSTHTGPQPAIGVAELIVGAALAFYGVRMLVHRPGSASTAELPRLLRMVTAVKPWQALTVAIALNLRPKAILLSIAVGIVIGSATLEVWQVSVALVIYVVLGASTVAVPVILYLARPERAGRPLRAAKSWIARHGRTVTFVVAVIIGTVVLGDGLGRL